MRPTRRLALLAGLVVVCSIWLSAQAPAPALARPTLQAPQATDADFAARVKEWTTRPEFLTPLVDHLPVVTGMPSPKDVLGYHIGTPKTLTRTADALAYYRALASALDNVNTPRVKVLTIGKTDEGRELNVIVVSSEESIETSTRIGGISGSSPTRATLTRRAGARGHRQRQSRSIT